MMWLIDIPEKEDRRRDSERRKKGKEKAGERREKERKRGKKETARKGRRRKRFKQLFYISFRAPFKIWAPTRLKGR